MTPPTRAAGWLTLLTLTAFFSSSIVQAQPSGAQKQIVLVHGKASHGYGGHAYGAAFRMLARMLNESVPAVHAVVVPEDGDLALLDKADAIVLGSDGGRLVKTLEAHFADSCSAAWG